MVKNVGKKKLDTLDNYSITPILMCLYKEDDNSNGIASKLNKSQSTIYTHLKNLEDEMFVIKSDKKQNAYSLNKSKILEEFFNFLLNKSLNHFHKDKEKVNNMFLGFKEQFLSNKYLIEILEDEFNYYSITHKNDKYSINGIFEDIVNLIIKTNLPVEFQKRIQLFMLEFKFGNSKNNFEDESKEYVKLLEESEEEFELFMFINKHICYMHLNETFRDDLLLILFQKLYQKKELKESIHDFFKKNQK